MKKTLIVAVAVVAALAVGWTGFWFIGKGEVEARMDAEIANLAARGDEISYSDREVSGFPFSYEMTLTDVEAKISDGTWVWRFPTLTSRAGADAPDRLVTILPAKFSAELRTTEAMRDNSPNLPEVLVFDVESENTVVTLSGLPGFNRELELSSDSLLAVHSQEAAAQHFAIELAELQTNAVLPADPSLEASSSGSLALIDFVFSTSGDDGRQITYESQVEDIRLTGTSNLRSMPEIEAMLRGEGAHRLSANYSLGRAISRFASTGGIEQGGSVTMTSGTASVIMSLDEGEIELRAESQANRIEITPEDESVAIRGGIDLDTLDAIYKVPFAPSSEMKNFDLKLAMIGLKPDAEVWDKVDAEKRLDRSPAEMTLDFEGTMRLTKSQKDVRPGEAPPVEFGNLSVKRVDLKALGANASARGDIEFLQPINAPVGTVTLRLNKVIDAMSKLVEAKVLTPDILLMGSVMAQTYLIEGDDPGELVAEIEMGPDGYKVNGQPLQ